MSFKDNVDFWNDYDWVWKSSDDVKQFIDDAVRTHVILESFREFGVGSEDSPISSEDWVLLWWENVQAAIQQIVLKFSDGEMRDSLVHLMTPMALFKSGGDQAIYDALLKYLPGFPTNYPEYANSLHEYEEIWCEFSWLSMGDWRYFLWIFYGRDNIAKSPYVDPEYLRKMFEESFVYEHPHQAIRVRIGLAMNPSTPKPILDFLFENREEVDWLLHDTEASSSGDELELLVREGERYEINSELEELEDLREFADDLQNFNYSSGNSFEDCPGVEYMENLFGYQITFETASEALKVALAHNTSLSPEALSELSLEDNEYVRYFLSKNRSISPALRIKLEESVKPITFQPYGSNIADEVTLN